MTEWVEIAEEGADPHDLDSPAPIVTVADEAKNATGVGHSEHTDTQEQSADDVASVNPVGSILGGAGLLVGVVAVVVAVLAYRRRV